MLDPVLRITLRREMHDHRMIRRPALRRIDARDGIRALGVAAKAVDSLSWKRDEFARIEQRGRVLDLRGAHGKALAVALGGFLLIRHDGARVSSS